MDTETVISSRVPPQLTPWLPGQSGNPNGRPKTSMRSILQEILEETDPKSKKIIKRKMIERLVELTDSTRDVIALAAIQDVVDRIDGKATQKTDLNIEGGEMLGAGVALTLFQMLQEQRKKLMAVEGEYKEIEDAPKQGEGQETQETS